MMRLRSASARQRQRGRRRPSSTSFVTIIIIVVICITTCLLVRSLYHFSFSEKSKISFPNSLRNRKQAWPIAISVSLPKSGTTSLYQMLRDCSPYHRVSHYCCGGMPDEGRHEYPCANEIQSNGGSISSSSSSTVCAELATQQLAAPATSEESSSASRRPMLLGFPSASYYDIFTQLDGEVRSNPKGYFLPQYSHLQELYEINPNAIWILTERDPQAWAKSVIGWLDLASRLQTEFGNKNHDSSSNNSNNDVTNFLTQFYNQHAQRVKDFVQTHPSITLVTLDITSPEAGTILANAIPGVESKGGCWKQHNAGPFFQLGLAK